MSARDVDGAAAAVDGYSVAGNAVNAAVGCRCGVGRLRFANGVDCRHVVGLHLGYQVVDVRGCRNEVGIDEDVVAVHVVAAEHGDGFEFCLESGIVDEQGKAVGCR